MLATRGASVAAGVVCKQSSKKEQKRLALKFYGALVEEGLRALVIAQWS
jgi:hypothetical protein